jgi:hypothetical protein
MKIEFISSSEDCHQLVPEPKSSRNYIPTWYRDMPTYRHKLTFDEQGNRKQNLRSCVPFSDAMRAGWIQETWCDLYIESTDTGITYRTSSGPEMIIHRDITSEQMVIDSQAFAPIELVWFMPWLPRTPKGWSVMITSPVNRFDLPFEVTTGIIDSDRFYHTPFGRIPFYVRRGFSGVIPAGTPMYQIVPFRRVTRWSSRRIMATDRETRNRYFSTLRKFQNVYRDEFWEPKHFD